MSSWTGIREFEAAVAKIAAQADVAAKVAVVKIAAKVEAEAKANFEGSHKKGEAHVGGDKPNVVSGSLRRSIVSTPAERYGMWDYGIEVGPTLIYGRRVELEYGYKFMQPAYDKVRPLMVEMLAGEFRKII